MAIEYITRQQITEDIDEIEYPRNDDNSINETRISNTIPFPRLEIEPYLAEAGYQVPVVEQADVDKLYIYARPIYRYYLTATNGARTEQIEEGYKNAIDRLKAIAKGNINLNIPVDDSDNGGSIDGLTIAYLDHL